MRATRNAILHVFILALGASATAQQPLADPPWSLLWAGGAPGALGRDTSQPSATSTSRSKK